MTSPSSEKTAPGDTTRITKPKNDASADPAYVASTAPGTPFEVGVRNGIRQFVNAPSDLNLLIEAAKRFGERTCVVDFDSAGNERRINFDQFFAWRDQLVPMLHIKRGDRVALCMRNRAEWLVGFLAIMKAGGVAVLMNSRGSGPEMLAMIEDTDPALVMVDERRGADIRAAGYTGRMFDMTKPLEPSEIEKRNAEYVPDTGIAQSDDPCAILFTSGTTGRAKGAVLTHLNVITGLMNTQLSGVMVMHNMARQMNIPMETLIANMPQQAGLLVSPLFHISGLGSGFLSPFMSGSKVVIMRRWDAQEAVRLIAREGITMFSAVPTMLWDILHRAKVADVDIASLRNIASGGQALPVNLVQELHALAPHAQIGTGYGMTECTGAIAQSVGPDFMARPAAAGRVLPMMDIRIEGPNGEALPTGEVGEIVVRGAVIMKCYWGRPEDTAAVLEPDGWLHTGDVGMVDDDGYVFIIDRKKDMVISGGENIYCAEVERVLGEIPQVLECATIGVPDERMGERLIAIVKAEGVTEAEIIDWVGQRLAKYKAPTRVYFSNEGLPRNAIGKVDKVALRKGWASLIGDQ